MPFSKGWSRSFADDGAGPVETVCGEESMNQLLVIDGVSVRQDNFDRYCLNELHRAAGGKRCYKPSFLRNLQQTNELVQLLGDTEIPVSAIKSQPYFLGPNFLSSCVYSTPCIEVAA